MIESASELPHGTILQTDICVIGAGAAGIVLTREFIGTSIRVVLLESGGFRRRDENQDLYRGESIGEPYYKPLHQCRSRSFGGSTNCWYGIAVPFTELDFLPRFWVPDSGWPLDLRAIQPYYFRAHDLCGAGSYVYHADAWKRLGLPAEQFCNSALDPFVWHINGRMGEGQIRFGRRFRKQLAAAPNVRVLLDTNAVRLQCSASSENVNSVVARTLGHKQITVKAAVVVLACGGLENPRILLSSSGRGGASLGNCHDLVGRYFHEHLQAPCGTLTIQPSNALTPRCSRLLRLGQSFCTPGFDMSDAAQAAHRSLHASLAIEPHYDADSLMAALLRLRSRMISPEQRHVGVANPKLTGIDRARALVRDARFLLPSLYRRLVKRSRLEGDPRKFQVNVRSEQAPNRESRVVLTREVDRLGMRRIALDWRTSDLDRHTFQVASQIAKSEFERAGLGSYAEHDWIADRDWPPFLRGGPHHMGTTRMAVGPRNGVVDPNCRVFGTDSLYIAGSSIFPTGGHANPTLTIIAFALRLADHLKLLTRSTKIGSSISAVENSV